jgi:chemotaxis protein histidine kinase CheA
MLPTFHVFGNGTMGSFNENGSGEYARLMAKAQAAVDALRDSYRNQFRKDVDQMLAAWRTLDEGADRRKVMEDIYGIAHNVKGQGGSFGYDFVTLVGASLCKFLRSAPGQSDDDLEIVHAHLSALDLASRDDMTGDGGEKGRKILHELSVMTGQAIEG